MQVVGKDQFDKCIASGEWFDHPNKVNEVKHERQIRRRKRRGLNVNEVKTESLECGAQL
jgi:hypothetical protein